MTLEKEASVAPYRVQSFVAPVGQAEYCYDYVDDQLCHHTFCEWEEGDCFYSTDDANC